MTREEKLYSMTMACLVQVANRLGIKIDKKGAKSKAIAKILEAEAQQDAKLVPMPGSEKLADVDKEVAKQQSQRASKKQKKVETDDELVAEIMNQKAELGIECPEIKSVEIVNAGDGTPLAEVGKEIVEQAKEKAKKASKKKASKKSAKKFENVVASRNDGQILVSDELDKNKAKYKIVGKRIRLLDADNKCFAYILTNKSNIRVYICESSESYSQIANTAVDNKYSKSRYNKTVVIEYNDVKAVVSLANTKN